MIEKELENQFYDGSRSPQSPLVINDAVHVTEGEHKGKKAAVISISSLEQELAYYIEFGDGSGDAVVKAEWLKLL